LGRAVDRTGGFIGGLVAYIAAWAIMADSSNPATPNRDRPHPIDDRPENCRCVAASRYFNVDPTLVGDLGNIDDYPRLHRLGIMAHSSPGSSCPTGGVDAAPSRRSRKAPRPAATRGRPQSFSGPHH
jgi:hypothetical protein